MPASVAQSSETHCASSYSHNLLFKRSEYAVWMPSNSDEFYAIAWASTGRRGPQRPRMVVPDKQ